MFVKYKRKKKWRGDLTETIGARAPVGAYKGLGLLELRARAVSHQLKKRWRKVKGGKELRLVFIYTIYIDIFSIFLKELLSLLLLLLLLLLLISNLFEINSQEISKRFFTGNVNFSCHFRNIASSSQWLQNIVLNTLWTSSNVFVIMVL